MAAETGQALNVGDAVLSFIGDTTQLDLAFDSIPAKTEDAVTRTKPAIYDLENTLQGLGTYYGQVGASAELAGAEMADGMEKGARASREAKAEVGLLGEATGIHLPRHIRGFVAELPGVGTALEAAFSATAVLFLIQALVEGTKKLTEWIGDTFIYTEAAKEQYKAQVELNNKIIEQNKAYDEAKDKLEAFGVTGSRKVVEETKKLSAAYEANVKQLNYYKDVIWLNQQGMVSATDAEIDKAVGQISLLTQTIKAQQEQMLLLQKQFAAESLQEYVAYQTAKLAATKTTGEADIHLQEAQAMAAIAGLKLNYASQAGITAAAEDMLYDLEMKGLADRLKLAKSQGEKGKEQVVSINAEIEAKTKEHEAKQIRSYADMMNKLRDIRSQDIPLVTSPLPEAIVTETTKQFDQLSKAAEVLGIITSDDLYNGLQKDLRAFQQLNDSGVAETTDKLKANIKVVQDEIDYQKSLGNSTKDLEKDLVKLQQQYDKLTGAVDKSKIKHNDFFTLMKTSWKNDTMILTDSVKNLQRMGVEAFNDFGKAAESAMESAILSQDSFGAALEKATAQTLAKIGAESMVYAIFYTAMGFAKMAEQDYVGAQQAFTAAAIYGTVGGVSAVAARALNNAAGGNNSTGGGSSQSGVQGTAPSGSVVTGNRNPVQVVNVQKFAAGGLVTSPTLAMIGDTKSGGQQQEAAIPLDDPQAVHAIVKALGGENRGGMNVYVKGMISSDNLTKVMKDMSRKVNKGTGHLASSKSFRLNKRSL